jgi:hypothetical protein
MEEEERGRGGMGKSRRSGERERRFLKIILAGT